MAGDIPAAGATPAQRFPNLLSPIELGPVTLRHRAVMSGHTMLLGDGAGAVGERLRTYLVERARGGAAMVTIESAPVRPDTLYSPAQVQLYNDAIVPDLARVADEVHMAGSTLSIILWHGGAYIASRSGHAAVAASAIPSIRGETPRPLAGSEIRELASSYAAAAGRCRTAGLDVVELQTAADYLLGSFLSPTLNRRSGEYGGSRANRTRIVREVLEAVRDAVGADLAVGVRTSASHLIPGDPAGYDLEESAGAMALLAEEGLLDWVSVITGSYWAFAQVIPPMSEPRAAVAGDAAVFRRSLPVPVIAAGRIRTPEEAEAILASEAADLIAMARTWIAEPEWATKVERGDERRIRPCISCNQACNGFVTRGEPGTCVVNPAAGRELELTAPEPAATPGRVAVIGAGPAGLETARVAALRGHSVTLHEARDRLGGDMLLASQTPGRAEIATAVEWWHRELASLGVDIRLAAAVEEEEELEADHVVWAVGATSAATAVWRLRPALFEGIPGAGSLPHAREVLRGERTVSGDVLVIDEEGGWPSVSLAETLASRREVRSVTVATALATFGEPELGYTLELEDVTTRLQKLGVVVHTSTLVEHVEAGRASVLKGGTLGPFDAVVLSTGTAAPGLDPNTLAVGDCVAPRGFWAAADDGARLARRL